ncbi:unnamed protein product [Didymodactylos carnosus]|uniref:Sulfotransferase family protein n=1 Tax=Didymodactylos carnosus TaxID=1234261 RepID=A0A815N5T4_9BILA|nr:unnamed protein product [Didymodactylos carnosus]CAF1522408.1 unnamed protein product [Didymodactylos carnosus]CAF4307539.1 unnamed protein product [Didymodactylos carnosus]CAF4309317.1 unnamed protein product [Didymodactylos carnosus]
MKVIGAGFGRTGTLSLKVALDQLGFPCYHFFEIFSTHPSHAKLWIKAYKNGTLSDWNEILQDYEATTDWPAAYFYLQLMKQFPEAKVILTVRDGEKWYKSIENTVIRMQKAFPGQFLSRLKYYSIWKMDQLIVHQGEFNNLIEDKEKTIQVFNSHIENVIKNVPKDRLLVYRIEEGWKPLCEFLNVPIPKTLFPHLNDTLTFQQRIYEANKIAWIYIIVTLSIIFVLFAWWLI